MASRREKLPRGKQPGEEHKSGYAALSQDNEEVAEEEIHNQPPDPEAEVPWKSLSHEEYKQDIEFLARFVHPNGFHAFGYQEVAQSLELLPMEFRAHCLTLKYDQTKYAQKVIATLSRWRAVPETLNKYRVMDRDITELLEQLHEALCDRELQWVSERADEPAVFWRWC